MKKFVLLMFMFGFVFTGAAVASKSGGVSAPSKAPKFRTAEASFYGKGSFTLASGRRVVSERHLFVAHKTLPFGTRVLFRRGGRETAATVLDRGPYIHGRIWDLSWRAAKALGLLRAGIGKVRYRVIRR